MMFVLIIFIVTTALILGISFYFWWTSWDRRIKRERKRQMRHWGEW